MPSTNRSRPDLLDVANAQAGLITSAQLAELGIRTSTTARRVAGYMWTRVLPGVHLVSGGQPTAYQREFAALLYAGPGSMLTGVTALRRYGIRAARLQEVGTSDPNRPEPVHVLNPHERRRISTGYTRVERTHRLPSDPLVIDGLLHAPLVRAAGDAVRRMVSQSDVLAILSEITQRGLATVDALSCELKAGNRRGSAHFRAAMAHLEAGVWSAPEGDLRSVVSESELPEPQWNVTVVTEDGYYIATPDGWFDDVALAAEVDSQEHHGFGVGLERTTRRNARYARAGVIVYPVTPAMIRDHPDAVRRELMEAYKAAKARPRPAVRLSGLRAVSAGRPGWPWGA